MSTEKLINEFILARAELRCVKHRRDPFAWATLKDEDREVYLSGARQSIESLLLAMGDQVVRLQLERLNHRAPDGRFLKATA